MTAALVIASGKTDGKANFIPSRMVGSITVAERIIILLRQADIQHVVVVCDEDDKMKRLHSYINLTFLPALPAGDMLDNIKIGLSYLKDKCSEALIVHVDIPLFSIRTIHTLTEAKGDICIPSYQGHWGNPVLLRQNTFEKIMACPSEKGMKDTLEALDVQMHIINVEDAGIRANIQQDSSYEKLLPDHDASKLRFFHSFSIGKERLFYDENTHRLLQLTEELDSLSRACSHMGISLNKGRTMIATIQQQLSCLILETQQGGKDGGYSHLTARAKSLMQAYSSFHSEADSILQGLFEKHFATQIDENQTTRHHQGGAE